jgi:hypothetical protein
MGKPRHAFDPHVLVVFLFVAIPFLVFGSFVVITMARGQLRDAMGENLEQQAVHTKLQLERYVADQIVHLRLLALSPAVRSALAAPASPAPLAEQLRAVLQVRPAVKVLQVVDAAGRVVTSTSRRGRSSYADTAWFGTVKGDSPDPVPYVGDFQRTPDGPAVLDIAYGVRDPADGRFLGAVFAQVDTTDLYGVLAPVRVGRTGHAVLLRSTDGLILASDESEAVLKRPFSGFDFIQAAIAERQGYWTIPARTVPGQQPGAEARAESARLVGFSPVEQVPGVRWLVAVEQHLDEATEPMRAATRYFGLHFLGTLLTVLVLAVYFSRKLEEPVIEEELHLHEEHVPASMREAGTPAR